MLTNCMTENDKKAALIDVRLVGAGVMPEVRVSPQFIQLEDHIVGYSDIYRNRQTITVTNVGKITCDISLQIKAEGQQDQYFTFLKSDWCVHVPENRLFTGLKTIFADEKLQFDVALSGSVNMLKQNAQLDAVVTVKVLLADGDSTGLEIPIKAGVIVSPICVS